MRTRDFKVSMDAHDRWWKTVTEQHDTYLRMMAGSLRCVRLASDISLLTLAKAMGFSATYLRDVENGRRGLTTELMVKYMDALGKLTKGKQQFCVTQS